MTKAKVSCGFMSVTPDQARAWLLSQTKNRLLSQFRVDLYAEMMKRNEWFLTNQGIAIDELGQLLDGQHRLQAIVQLDRPVEMLVVRNINNRAQLVLDQPLIRRAHDQIAIQQGWKITPAHIAVAKQMIAGIHRTAQLSKTLKDVLIMNRYYVQHHKAIEWTVAQFDQHAKIQGVTVAPVMAPIARAWYRENKQRLASFCEILSTGLTSRAGDSAAVVLRNWLIASRDKKISVRRYDSRQLFYKKAAMALRAFLDKQSLARLPKDIDVEPFPIPRDIKLIKAQTAA